MDDDPEPTLHPVIPESCEASEQLRSFTEQKCSPEVGDEGALEVAQPQESGDIGPAIEPESPKKSISAKDLKDQALQTASKTSIFRRNKWRDEGQQVDPPPGSVKNSTTSLRKPSRRSSHRLLGQESRRGSQQAAGPQPALSQKPSRAQSINEVDAKDAIWVSQRTGKVMKSRSQQTSRIWERKALSEILNSSVEDSSTRKEESDLTTTEDDFASSGETTSEKCTEQESRHSSEQLEGKASKHRSQQHLVTSGSRQSSQPDIEPPTALSPKYSCMHLTKGTDTDEDIAWISQITGREMNFKAQLTGPIWGTRRLSDMQNSSGQDFQTDIEEESGFSLIDEFTSSGERGQGGTSPRESRRAKKQLEYKGRLQRLGAVQAHRTSLSTGQPYTLHRKSSREECIKERSKEPVWVSQKTGKEVKCKAQQTSIIWINGTVSDILRVDSQGSEETSEDEGTTEDEERGQREEQGVSEGSQHTPQHLAEKKSGQKIQQVEEQELGEPRRNGKNKTDRAQQTDSVESIKKVLTDNSQQTDIFEDMQTSLVDLSQDPGRSTEQTDVQESRHSSQELVGQGSLCSSPQEERRGSQRSSQQSLRSEAKATDGNTSEGLSAAEREPAKTDQASCDREAEKTSSPVEDTWVSRKTGRVVRNQGQQTDRSWIQYFAAKSQKLKRCISQQTEESFLQRYKATRMAVREHRKNHAEQDIRKCTECGDIYGEHFNFALLEALSLFSTMPASSTTCTAETADAKNAAEHAPSTSGRNEDTPQTQQGSRRGSQQWGGQGSPKGVGQVSRQGSLQASDANMSVKRQGEFRNHTPSESSLPFTEGEEKMQQTYSMISFDDGIWLNKMTGKLLVSHNQQTSETRIPESQRTALGGKSRRSTEEALRSLEMHNTSSGGNQQGTDLEGKPPSGPGSRRDGPQDQNSRSHSIKDQPAAEGSQNVDDIEKLVCSRLSEATLLSMEYPDVEDEPQQIYTVICSQKGTWMNVKTSKLVTSQSQQTEESSPQKGTEENGPFKGPSQEGPAEMPLCLQATT